MAEEEQGQSEPSSDASTSEPKVRACKRCEKPETESPFEDEFALTCITCHAERVTERKGYERSYHGARSRAVSRLIKAHRAEFEMLLFEERFPDESDDD